MKGHEKQGLRPDISRRALDKALVEEATWLEHMESEMENMCRASEIAELELVLKNSPDDLETFETLKRVRAAVKSLSDDVALPESGLYYDQLHAKIMVGIDAEIASEASRPSQRAPLRNRSLAWPSIFRAAGLTMMIAVISWLGLHPSSVKSSKTDQVATHSTAAGEIFGRSVASIDAHEGATVARDLGSFESEEDFVTEAAEARLRQVSRTEADAMIRSLKM